MGNVRASIIVFEDGTFYTASIGNKDMKSSNFLDAKKIEGDISDRDLKNLNIIGMNYELKRMIFFMAELY